MVRQHLDDALTQETLPAVDGTIFNNIINTNLATPNWHSDIITVDIALLPQSPLIIKHIHGSNINIVHKPYHIHKCLDCFKIILLNSLP